MLNNKRILVAGAAGLLGKTAVNHIVASGAEVVAVDIDIHPLKQIAELMPNIELRQLDITHGDDVKHFFDNLANIDGAVNLAYPRNASYGKHFFDVTVADFNENVSLHLGSSFLFAQQCARYFMKNKTPFSLVTLSSIYGVVAPRFHIYEGTSMTVPVEYAAIKSAILQLNKYIANYVGHSDFRINSVSPGGIFNHQPEAFLSAYKKETLGAGMLSEKDIMGAITFLLSDHSRYINGENLIVDDGFTL